MTDSNQILLWRLAKAAQVISMITVALLALVSLSIVGAMAAGFLPWPELFVSFGDGVVLNVAPALILIPAIFAVLLLAYMPANWRVMALENSHRSFQMGMEDVANAYWAVHEADRSGIFQIRSEYDSVKERILFLRDHTDLAHLEPEILELAAEMSHTSRDLAVRYSDEAIDRARHFLAERTEEVARLEHRLETALEATRELKRTSQEVEMQEQMAASRVSQLVDELNLVLPELGIEPIAQGTDQAGPDVISFSERRGVAAE